MKVQLRQGARYAAKLHLSFLESMATEAALREGFEGAGFSGVAIYDYESELPPWWPADLRGTGSGVRFVAGTWVGASQTVDLPSQVVAYREIPSGEPLARNDTPPAAAPSSAAVSEGGDPNTIGKLSLAMILFLWADSLKGSR